MKAFTDLKQSKKLAEILPIESADMYWLNRHIDLTETKYEVFVIDKSNKYVDFFKSYAVAIDNNEIIPCWSLAALLDALPRIDIEKELWYSDKYDYRVKAYIGDGYIGDWFDNPIDACVDMIIILKEQNLL